MANLELVALIVREYDPAIRFFVDVLGFELIEDTPSLTNDGRPKRWVVVRPAGTQTGILLARADGERQVSTIGQQFAGRVGFFLRVEDFDATYERLSRADVHFVSNLASNRMVTSPYFSTSKATAGICSAPIRSFNFR